MAYLKVFRYNIPFVFLLIILLQFCTVQRADLILYNGTIYTLDNTRPVVRALAIRSGEILSIGSNSYVERFSGEDTRRIDLQGMYVYPGFCDAHIHLGSLGESLRQVNLVGTRSLDEIREVLERVAASGLQEGEWIQGRGWDHNDWPKKAFPTRFDLDDLFPENPVVLERVAGHAIWVNSIALELAGIEKNNVVPRGGSILRDEEGQPTGILLDNAQELIWRVVPARNEQQVRDDLLSAIEHCLSLGLTQVHAMSVNRQELKALKALELEGELRLRVYAVPGRSAFQEIVREGIEIPPRGGMLTVRAVKFFIDGALGSRGALLFEPYSDDPGNTGLQVTSIEELLRLCSLAAASGFQVCTHAIGDKGNSLVLQIYHQVLGRKGSSYRWRIEHAQVVRPEDIPLFAKYGIIPSMQPTHATSDMYWAEARLGSERIKGAYAWRSFLNSGVVIPAGSDAPVESANPLLGFYAAITRQDTTGFPESGWYSQQCMSREQALRSMTLWPAYASFQERYLGKVAPGYLADLTVLDRDIMKIPPDEIIRARVLYTIVGGKIQYQLSGGDNE